MTHEIEVWKVYVGSSSQDDAVLSFEERQRAAQLGGHAGKLYAAAHAALRRVLGDALDLDATEVRFERTCRHCGDPTHGKPTVRGGCDIGFSLSYSPRMALMALSRGSTVGVDVHAAMHPERPHRWCFAPTELAYLDGLGPLARDEAIARAWARKEAVAKADGRGLDLPLSEVVVARAPVGGDLQVGIGSTLGDDERTVWHVSDLDLKGTASSAAFSELVAAVASEVPQALVNVATWEAGR